MSNGAEIIRAVWQEVLTDQILKAIDARGKEQNKKYPFTLTALQLYEDATKQFVAGPFAIGWVIADQILTLRYEEGEILNIDYLWSDRLLCATRAGGGRMGPKVKPPVLVFLTGNGDPSNPLRGRIGEAGKLEWF